MKLYGIAERISWRPAVVSVIIEIGGYEPASSVLEKRVQAKDMTSTEMRLQEFVVPAPVCRIRAGPAWEVANTILPAISAYWRITTFRPVLRLPVARDRILPALENLLEDIDIDAHFPLPYIHSWFHLGRPCRKHGLCRF
jgi:hypothetical protein